MHFRPIARTYAQNTNTFTRTRTRTRTHIHTFHRALTVGACEAVDTRACPGDPAGVHVTRTAVLAVVLRARVYNTDTTHTGVFNRQRPRL